MRICPRCTFPLRELPSPENPKVKIDFCRRCKGTFIEPENLIAIYGKDIDLKNWLDREGCEKLGLSELHCPIDDTVMHLYRIHMMAPNSENSKEKKFVEIDICHNCSGIWFDPHEAQQLLSIVKANRHIIKERDRATVEQIEREADIMSYSTYYFQLFTGLPIEDYNPVRKKPIVLLIIFSLLIFLYILEVWMWSIGTEKFRTMIESWGMIPKEFFNGRYITLVTHIFLHDAPNPFHLLGNLYFLYVFGDNIEDLLGYKNFLLIFFLSGIIGGMFWLTRHPDSSAPLIGASGAISGLMGAYMILFPRVKVWVVIFFIQFKLNVIVYLSFWIGYQIFMSLYAKGYNVAFEAHIGGFIAGAFIAVIIKKLSKKTQRYFQMPTVS